MENNNYYEPTIKTARDNKQFKEDLLNVCGNFAKMSLDCIEKQNNELEQLQNEQQQLISFLENKIEECDRYLKTFEGKEQGDYSVHYYYAERDKKDFQEVLDFVNGDGKDE